MTIVLLHFQLHMFLNHILVYFVVVKTESLWLDGRFGSFVTSFGVVSVVHGQVIEVWAPGKCLLKMEL